MENKPFIIERTFSAPIDKVWSAITNAEEMKQWYFDLPGFRPEVGYEFTFHGGKPGEKQFLHVCKITEVIPGKKLTHSWRYPEEFDAVSYVTFELTPEGNQTKVKLTHEGLDKFPQDKNFARHNFEAGWTDIIGRSLKEFVEKD